jgi:hypothetical protein
LTPQQVLRSLILMRVKNWDYRELRERIADGCTLRLFTGFRCRPVPKHNAFHRAFVRLTPATLRMVNDLVVKAFKSIGWTWGGTGFIRTGNNTRQFCGDCCGGDGSECPGTGPPGRYMRRSRWNR